MKYFSPLDFGAQRDGTTDDAKAIQSAIDFCFESGGGTVLLECGVFYSSSIILRKNVDLHIAKSAVLKASSEIETYLRPCDKINDPKTALVGNPVVGKPSFAFIYAFGADNCSISGGGVIDANCFAFVHSVSQYYTTGSFYPRPTAIYIENSNHITIEGVTIQNSPFWTLHPAGCDDVLISKIRILNPLFVANSDGIDPDHCTNVRILGCHIECADDCICLKNTNGNREYGTCENIIISDCTLISTSAAIKIGTEGVDNFKNIIVKSCIISKSNRGISIQIRDKGSLENALFSDIFIETRRFCNDWWGTAEPIAITCLRRDENTVAGHIKNVQFKNISCTGENGVLVFENVPGSISDVSFENVNVELKKSSKWPLGVYDLRPAVDFEIISQPNCCFFIHGGSNITTTNCTTIIKPNEYYSKQTIVKQEI